MDISLSEAEKVAELKDEMIAYAFDLNNRTLQRAVRYCKTLQDLQRCVRQAQGVGSERFRKTFAYIRADETELEEEMLPSDTALLREAADVLLRTGCQVSACSGFESGFAKNEEMKTCCVCNMLRRIFEKYPEWKKDLGAETTG